MNFFKLLFKLISIKQTDFTSFKRLFAFLKNLMPFLGQIERGIDVSKNYEKLIREINTRLKSLPFFNIINKELKNLSKTLNINKRLLNSLGLNKVTSLINIANKNLFKDKSKQYKGFDRIDFSFLSSSALLAGYYVTASEKSRYGELTITFKVGNLKSYTYAKVPKEVWEHMKSATGEHGTGAMGIFWREFLWPNGYGKKNPRRKAYQNLVGFIRSENAPFLIGSIAKKAGHPKTKILVRKQSLQIRSTVKKYQKSNKYVKIRRA